MKTLSESRVEKSNKHYNKIGKAKIQKVEAKLSKVEGKFIYTSSRGLDYAGVLDNGQHIEFEVKETSLDYLPVSNIRITQVDQMQSMEQYGANTFLLIYFSKHREWYRINPKEVYESLIYNKIQIEYARAYGYFVDVFDDFCPNFLNPIEHPAKQIILDQKDIWFPKIENIKSKEIKELPKRNKAEILESVKKNLIRGIKNAEKKVQQTEQFFTTGSKKQDLPD